MNANSKNSIENAHHASANTLQSMQLATISTAIRSKIVDYKLLIKFRLTLTVVFSAAIGYLFALGSSFNIIMLLALSLGGFLVTASANALNVIFEKDYDKLMERTANRPLATGRMSITEALLVAGISGILGISILAFCFNTAAAVLGAISLISYAFVYTPLKRVAPIAVFVGAIPGGLPPLIGWVAATGSFNYIAWWLFSVQFLWQLPHFWAIAWLGLDSYKKAGYKFVTQKSQSKDMAIIICLYICTLIVISTLSFFFKLTGVVSLIASILLGVSFLLSGLNLVKKQNRKAALQVMIASIIYLPLLQIVMVLDRIFW